MARTGSTGVALPTKVNPLYGFAPFFYWMALEGWDLNHLMPRHCVPRAEMLVPNLPMPASANHVANLGAVRAEMRVLMLPVSAAPNLLATFDPV